MLPMRRPPTSPGLGSVTSFFAGKLWLVLLLGAAGLLVLGGGTVLVLTYVDEKSFVKMMDAVLKKLGISNPDARLGIIAHAGVETKMGTDGSSEAKKTFNFWNITAGSLWKGKTLAGKDKEYGKTITQLWRVYADPMEAAKDYLSFLSRDSRLNIKREDGTTGPATASYRDALNKLMVGDLRGFVYTLRDAGYYTAPAEDYYRMISGQYNKAKKLLAA